jgi:hypothetical protein
LGLFRLKGSTPVEQHQISRWIVQIYEMADEDAQSMVGGILSGIEGLTVEFAISGPDRFLIVDCATAVQAVSVHRFVTAIDPNAVIIQTSTGSEPTGSERALDVSVG